MKTSKGQVTLTNLMAVMLSIVVYAVTFPVIVQPFINDITVYYTANPTPFSSATVLILQMVPFILICSICLTALNYAIPRREAVNG